MVSAANFFPLKLTLFPFSLISSFKFEVIEHQYQLQTFYNTGMEDHIIHFHIIPPCDTQISKYFLVIVPYPSIYQKSVLCSSAFPSAHSVFHWNPVAHFYEAIHFIRYYSCHQFQHQGQRIYWLVIIHCFALEMILLSKNLFYLCQPLQDFYFSICTLLLIMLSICVANSSLLCCEKFQPISSLPLPALGIFSLGYFSSFRLQFQPLF